MVVCNQKTMTNCHAFEVGGNLEFVLAMVFLPCRRILQSEKCVDWASQNFWSVSDTTDRPKFYFRTFVSNPPHIFLYHKALTKQRTNGHHELFHCSHRFFSRLLAINWYWHGPLPVLAFNGTRTSKGRYAFMSTTSIGTVHCRYWHLMVPEPVLAYLCFCPISVLARYITGTGIKRCPCQYRHLCILVQYQYQHGIFSVRALNGARISIGIFAL
jgi:hypothetical protein